VSAKDFFDDGLRASRHTDQLRVCLHIERCGKQLLFRTLELEFLLEASREQPTAKPVSARTSSRKEAREALLVLNDA
jgi:hypothetical protein